MNTRKYAAWVGVLLAVVFLAPSFARAQAAKTSGNAIFTVTAVGKKDADVSNISKDSVQLFQGKERKQIGDWKKGDALFLAVLIDDSIDSTAGSQWDYLREFITSQPASTYVLVGYIRDRKSVG